MVLLPCLFPSLSLSRLTPALSSNYPPPTHTHTSPLKLSWQELSWSSPDTLAGIPPFLKVKIKVLHKSSHVIRTLFHCSHLVPALLPPSRQRTSPKPWTWPWALPVPRALPEPGGLRSPSWCRDSLQGQVLQEEGGPGGNRLRKRPLSLAAGGRAVPNPSTKQPLLA